ncbi:MAG: SBBP repeat-containing protein [Candidatus Odinarchaeota archaeon]
MIKIRLKRILILIISLFFLSNFFISFLVNETYIEKRSDKILNTAAISENPNLEEWNTKWGGSSHDRPNEFIVDSSNNLYIVGYTESYGNGGADVVVIKYKNMIEYEWDFIWGGSNDEFGYDITVDLSGDFYITGYTSSFGNGDNDIIIIKYNSMGDQLWNRTWGGINKDSAYEVVIDSFNDVYIIGRTESFGNGALDMVVIKYNTIGEQLWNRTWGGIGYDVGFDVILDSSNNLYISGVIGMIQVGDVYGHKYLIGGDVFLVKFNGLGEELWNNTWGTAYGDYAYKIAIDSSNNIYITGTYKIKYQGEPYIPYGGDIFLSKYSTSGTLFWNESWGSADHEESWDLAISSLGYVYILVWTDEPAISYLDNSSITLVKFNRTGEYIWDESWSDYDGENFPVEIEFGFNNNLFILGETYSYIQEVGVIVVLHYNETGEFLWYTKWNETDNNWCYDMYIDVFENIYILGETWIGDGSDIDMVLIRFSYSSRIENEIPSDIIFLIMILSLTSLIIIILTLQKRISNPAKVIQ